MTKFMLLMLMWAPCTVFAASDCQIVEYADHYEAICVGDAQRATPTLSQAIEPVQVELEQVVASAQISEPELPDLAPEYIVRNELGRLHGEYWLRSQGR